MQNKLLETAPPIIRRSQVMKRLGRQVFDDMVGAKWITPCAVKPSTGKQRANASVFYSIKDIIDAEKRILGGEYPPRKLTKKVSKK